MQPSQISKKDPFWLPLLAFIPFFIMLAVSMLLDAGGLAEPLVVIGLLIVGLIILALAILINRLFFRNNFRAHIWTYIGLDILMPIAGLIWAWLS